MKDPNLSAPARPVESRHCCRCFDRDSSSLEEEPAACENCRHWDSGLCHLPVEDGPVYDNGQGGQYGSCIVQTLQYPSGMGTPEFAQIYRNFAKRILWMDGDVVPGAFQMNTAWYCKVPERDPIFTEHAHPYSELLGFFGSDPEDPYDLNAELIFTIGGEAHRITRSSMIYLPADIPHNPMRILRVDKPIFHFSIVTNSTYDGEATYR